MDQVFDARAMYGWAEALNGIINDYAQHFAHAPEEVSRRFSDLRADARSLRSAIYEEVSSGREGSR